MNLGLKEKLRNILNFLKNFWGDLKIIMKIKKQGQKKIIKKNSLFILFLFYFMIHQFLLNNLFFYSIFLININIFKN